MKKKIEIKNATEKDIRLILHFIKELADYEKLINDVIANEENLKKTLFGKTPYAKALLAFLNKKPVGFAIYFFNFSSFMGKPGIYIEDIYVKENYRGNGIGKAIFKYIGKIAKENDCGRIEWSVLNWNKPSINFYNSLGAKPMDEWTVYRLSGSALNNFIN